LGPSNSIGFERRGMKPFGPVGENSHDCPGAMCKRPISSITLPPRCSSIRSRADCFWIARQPPAKKRVESPRTQSYSRVELQLPIQSDEKSFKHDHSIPSDDQQVLASDSSRDLLPPELFLSESQEHGRAGYILALILLQARIAIANLPNTAMSV